MRLVDDLLDVTRITRGKLELRQEPVELRDVVGTAVETSQPADRGREPRARPSTLPAGADLRRRRPGAPRAGVRQPAQQRRQVHRAAAGASGSRAARAGGEVGRRSATTASASRPTCCRASSTCSRRSTVARARAGRARHRADAGQAAGRAARRQRRGAQRRAGPRQRVRRCACPRQRPPRARRTGSAAEARRRPRPARRILVVDDNARLGHSLADAAPGHGHTRCARPTTGTRRSKSAAEFRPEIVLLDIGMPRMNGYEAARRIPQQPWGEEHDAGGADRLGPEEDRRRSREAGFDHHLVKPVEPAAVARLLGDAWMRIWSACLSSSSSRK